MELIPPGLKIMDKKEMEKTADEIIRKTVVGLNQFFDILNKVDPQKTLDKYWVEYRDRTVLFEKGVPQEDKDD